MIKSVLVCYLFIFAFAARALVPVEGILLGEVLSEYQNDPLYYIFADYYDKTQTAENAKLRLYQSAYQSGLHLQESCSLYSAPNYSTVWMEKQAKRSMVATLQYIGLDISIKAIGAYAKRFEMGPEAFQKLSTNLVKNYCSKNITVYSIKRLEQAIKFYYENPEANLIPTIETSPFVTSTYKTTTESTLARSAEFDQALNNFKAFCSWGGDVSDYRLLVPYLKNSFIMAYLIKHMTGVQDRFDEKQMKVNQVPVKVTAQVSCTDLICRKVKFDVFKESFPRSIGSTGLYTDLAKIYCHHFRLQDYMTSNAIVPIKDMIKKLELEDPIFETSFFISLITGVPDAVFGVEKYRDLPGLAKSSIDERWNKWANDVLGMFSKDMLFEESIKIKSNPLRDPVALRTGGFVLDFSVTLGEMDRIVDNTDKLALSFDLKLSKNYLRHMKTKWNIFTNEIDIEGREKFANEIAQQLGVQLKDKERYFRQKMWNEKFSKLIVQELIGQLLSYRGPLFDSYQDQILRIPVKFSYGVFALGYLRYRADVNAGRLKLNL